MNVLTLSNHSMAHVSRIASSADMVPIIERCPLVPRPVRLGSTGHRFDLRPTGADAAGM